MMTAASWISLEPSVRLLAPELFRLRYGSMLSEPLMVNRFETPGSPNTEKLPYPPPVLTVTPGAVNA